jgi:hypothetical protein
VRSLDTCAIYGVIAKCESAPLRIFSEVLEVHWSGTSYPVEQEMRTMFPNLEVRRTGQE